MIGIDTSFLVGLAVREHPVHPACRALFESEILGRPGSMALAPQVLAEFAHVVTDPRRFEQSLSMPRPWNSAHCGGTPTNAGSWIPIWKPAACF